MNVRALLPAAFFVFISCGVLDHLAPYTPQIVFNGEIDGVEMHLPGYVDFPNACRIAGDSVIMDLYSDDYDPSTSSLTNSTGTYLRIKVFPQPGDTIFPKDQVITERNCQVHYVVHSSVGDCSYDITPDDTLSKSQTFSMEIVGFARSRGASISFDAISAVSRSISPNCASADHGIRDGTISGSIE